MNEHKSKGTASQIDKDHGVSSRALSVARVLDRLPEGNICVIISKEETAPWHVEFSKLDKLRVMDIHKRG